jgi:two-component system NtrC family sensor kinase
MFNRVPNEPRQPSKNWLVRALHRLSISHKISCGYALTLGIAVLGTTAGFVIGDYCQQKARLQEKNAQDKIRTLQHLQTVLLHVQAHKQSFLTSVNKPERLREDYNHFLEHVTEFNQAWSTFKATYEKPKTVPMREIPGELATFKRLVLTNDKFIGQHFQQVALILKQIISSNVKPEEREKAQKQLLKLSDSTLELKIGNLVDTLTDLIHFADREYEHAQTEGIAAEAIRVRIIATSISLSVALALVLAIYTSRAIAHPIQATTKVAQLVTQDKNFNLQAPIMTDDEVGVLTASLNQLILQVNQLLEDQKAANYTQLIQSEKMSSLGRMITGVAHEINDPVNFIYGNSLHANDYVKDLLALLDTYTREIPNPPEAVQAKREEIDFDFLKEDVLKLLDSMKLGAERTAEIIMSLRDFSQLDEAIAHPVDLHACINSTLLILNSRLKQKITVIRNYGNIPEIKGYAGLLYQVFMNLLSNAIDALEASKNDKRITITTDVQEDNWVVVKIADNGSGISADERAKIFDDFFTTKPPGLGKRLGLVISHQIIVEKHGGTITCNSEVGVGSEFAIALPIQQKSLGNWGLGTEEGARVNNERENFGFKVLSYEC